MNSCEESRYIKQLELHFGVKIHRYVAKSTILEAKDTTEIAKTQEDIAILKNTRLSATALQQYLSCPVQFYYSKIKKLTNEDEVNETLDAGLIGSVLHESIEEIYSGKARISKDFLSECLKKESYAEVVRRHIMDNLKCLEISGRNLIYESLIRRYVRQILLTDRNLLEKKNLDSFRILELEKKETDVIGGLKFIGIMDRVDSFEDGVIRVVDYKTGDADRDADSLRRAHELQARMYADVLLGRGSSHVECAFVCVERDDGHGGPVVVRYAFDEAPGSKN